MLITLLNLQIRRFMGLAFNVGFGHLNIETIRQMLKDPTFQAHTHNPRLCRMAVPKGLHLADVYYSPEYLGDITDNGRNLPIGPPPEYPSPDIQWYAIISTLLSRKFL